MSIAVDETRRIHILGTGSVGKLIAHGLRGVADPPPITLLFHRAYLMNYTSDKTTISIETHGASEERAGFDAELILPLRRRSGAIVESPDRDQTKEKYQHLMESGTIHCLIVTVKAHQTVAALDPIKHRLGPDSTILFLQNGMGVIEEVNENVFPDPSSRPRYMLGINSHGVYSTGKNSAVHAGHGVIYLGILPPRPGGDGEKPENPFTPTSRHLLRSLTRVPVLAAVGLEPTALFEAQLEKLAVNCIINPLTVLLDSRNGDLLENNSIRRTIRLLLAEICVVIQSLPELRGIPNIKTKFSHDRLESIVNVVAKKTAMNISSMLQDTRKGLTTEVNYINGYIVKRGEEMGIKPVLNYMIMQLVKGKRMMIAKEVENYNPLERSRNESISREERTRAVPQLDTESQDNIGEKQGSSMISREPGITIRPSNFGDE